MTPSPIRNLTRAATPRFDSGPPRRHDEGALAGCDDNPLPDRAAADAAADGDAATGCASRASPRGPQSVHDFCAPGLCGEDLVLAEFSGRPIMVVNTASECDYTPQYTALEALWRRYRGRGFVILGAPSNDFGEQEPGPNETIAAFCRDHYEVTFPMTARLKVVGPMAHPLYRWIAKTVGDDAAPRWNFHKYLFDGEGVLMGYWPSRIRPEDPKIVRAIELALHNAAA